MIAAGMAGTLSSRFKQPLRYLVVTAAALGLSLTYSHLLVVNQTTVALSFLILILLVAFGWGLAQSIYLSLLCTVLYNFFFLPPMGTLTVADPQNWVALLSFMATGILVSHLSAKSRRETEVARQRREEVEKLYEFSRLLLMEDKLLTLAEATPGMVGTIFGLRAVTLYLPEHGRVYSSSPKEPLATLEELREAATGNESTRVLPGGARLVPLMLGLRPTGALALTEGAYSDGLYEALGGLVAVALERASVLERTSRIEAAREGERLRSTLLDSVAHELKTPLTAIRAAATSLLTQPGMSVEERRELLLILDEESAQLDKLTNEALAMAQMDAAAIHVRLWPQDVREVVELALDDLRTLLRGRQVSMSIAPEVREVAMDRELVRRVLRHLIENAAQYSQAGSPIEISGCIDGSRLVIEVEDHGQGIDAAEQAAIFERFYRGRGLALQVRGTGMGLAIVRSILQAHRGGIEVVSRPGSGSKFRFWLPLNVESIEREMANREVEK
jgi:two-component system, OmpR family, sensor histidine kinase KdpD